MAYLFTAASLHYIEASGGSYPAFPYAMGCWFKTTDLINGNVLMSVVDKDVTSDRHLLMHRGDVSGDPIRLLREGASNVADSTSGYSSGVWSHAIGIFASATDCRVLLNGGSKGTNTNSVAMPAADKVGLGRAGDSTPNGYFDGDIAEAAWWSLSSYPGATDALKADAFEATVIPALAKGYAPSFFPLGLRGYWPLLSNFNDTKGINNLSGTSPEKSAHPRIIYPSAQILQFHIAAAGGTFTKIAGGRMGMNLAGNGGGLVG